VDVMNNEKIILQKLKSKAVSKDMPFQLILQLFCQEEFLRKLERSEFHDQLILKGGLFLFSYSGFESRPTMDIDFLAQNLSNDEEEMEKIINRICQVKTENEFIRLEIKSTEVIAEMKAYHGVRLKMLAMIANTKTPFDVDIGIGDIIVPAVNEVEIPTQLAGFVAPKVASYSLESTIAEKLEAMFDRMETTSRMKDYYDIYYLASHYDFDGSILIEAISHTFTNRGTDCTTRSLNRIAVMYKDSSMINRWKAFTKKSLAVPLDFVDVIQIIISFIKPIIHSIEEGKVMHKKWSKDYYEYIEK
jgi:predicted nucleotidyltransferase component of viral defense system